MTVEEFWQYCHRPEYAGRTLEISRGHVIEWPRPYLNHGVAAVNVGVALHVHAERTGSGFVTAGSAGLVLERDPATVRGPDVAYFPADTPVDDSDEMWTDTLPLLAAEVRSANDPAGQPEAMIDDLIRGGVPEVWLVDPDGRTLTEYRRGVEPRTYCGAEVVTSGVLPGFALRVADLFRTPAERARA